MVGSSRFFAADFQEVLRQPSMGHSAIKATRSRKRGELTVLKKGGPTDIFTPLTASDISGKIVPQKVAKQIWDSSKLLAFQPGIGRPGRVAGTRELVMNGLPYILPYTEKAGTIFILRVIHTSMRWPDEL